LGQFGLIGKNQGDIMSLIDYIKPLLKEGTNIEEVTSQINKATTISSDAVKEWISKPENKPTFDSIVGKAITTHIEKEKASRAEWEQTKAVELLEQAKNTIAKENQKTPEMLKIEELEKQLNNKTQSELLAKLKTNLLDVVKTDKLAVPAVDPFLQYGENAETELRKFNDNTQSLIDELVKKQLNDKFGGEPMPDGEKPIDDKEVSTADFLKAQGIPN
jgi:hypothetical protein